MVSYEYLHKRVTTTSKARYEASRRLKFQSWASQWTLSYLTVGQIILSLLPLFGLTDSNISADVKSIVAVLFAVMILAYSLLLGMGDFSARSVKIHQCGLELGELARELKYLLDHKIESTKFDYLDYVERYYRCLGKYENHSKHDYLVAKKEFQFEVAKTEKNKIPFLTNVNWTLWIYWFRFFGFCHYVVSAGAITFWIYKILSVGKVNA